MVILLLRPDRSRAGSGRRLSCLLFFVCALDHEPIEERERTFDEMVEIALRGLQIDAT